MGKPWPGPVSRFPHPPVPILCTCNPDCSGLEVRLSLEELNVGAAQAGETGGEGVSRVSRWPDSVGRGGSEQLQGRCKRQVQKQVPACCAAAPGVKVNLKPGPSQLSKQKQRLAQADEYSSPQKSNPSAPASTQKPGSSWDHQAGERNPKGRMGLGRTGASLLSFLAP